jgi:hypothetical protein
LLRFLLAAECTEGSGRLVVFTGNQFIMPNLIRVLAKAALLSAAFVVVAAPGTARAQSGSAGGSIGNDEKSLSGSRETPRSAEPSKPSRKPEAEEPRRASRKSGGGGGGNFDGAWVFNSMGTPCGAASEAAVITSGKILGQYGTGQVSSNGSATGIGAAGGITWTSIGRLSARGGSGTFRRSDGCVGTWTASKQ